MTLGDIQDLFLAGYDDKARITIESPSYDVDLENIRIIDSKLKPYLNRKVIGLVDSYTGLRVIVESGKFF